MNPNAKAFMPTFYNPHNVVPPSAPMLITRVSSSIDVILVATLSMSNKRAQPQKTEELEKEDAGVEGHDEMNFDDMFDYGHARSPIKAHASSDGGHVNAVARAPASADQLSAEAEHEELGEKEEEDENDKYHDVEPELESEREDGEECEGSFAGADFIELASPEALSSEAEESCGEAAEVKSPLSLPQPVTRCDSMLQLVPETEVVGHGASEQSIAQRLGPQDFTLLRMVGQGAFGKVFQVMCKKTNCLYAMKVMRKDNILKNEHSEYIKAERDVLTQVLHPYIVTLRYSFQTSSKLYLILDFINGGHLFFNLYKQGIFSEDSARLYTAEIVLAISYLHDRGIVHRDLKPENVLLDSDGHIKITDFGLAKAMGGEADRTNSFIGTMEYMAPEVVSSRGHNKAVDWWSTGVLLYEMLCGLPPFRAKSKNALQKQIVSGKINWPKHLTGDAMTLLKGLLCRDPERRLGSGPDGSNQIKAHKFFKSINWAKLERGEVPSIFKPTISNTLSVDNFDKIWTDQPAVDSPCAGTPTTTSAGMFKDFTYTAPSMLAEMVSFRLSMT